MPQPIVTKPSLTTAPKRPASNGVKLTAKNNPQNLKKGLALAYGLALSVYRLAHFKMMLLFYQFYFKKKKI